MTNDLLTFDDLELNELIVTSIRDSVELPETGASGFSSSCSASSCCASSSCCSSCDAEA
jgi:hypothetical protein